MKLRFCVKEVVSFLISYHIHVYIYICCNCVVCSCLIDILTGWTAAGAVVYWRLTVTSRLLHTSTSAAFTSRLLHTSTSAALTSRLLHTSTSAALTSRLLHTSTSAALTSRLLHTSTSAALISRLLHTSTSAAFTSRLLHTSIRSSMDLRSVVGHLEAIAPSSRAENWDNVGVLVEPSGNPAVNSVLLTTDLTEEVMTEAEERGVGLVVSYHPPIFHPLKRLTQCTAQERTVVRALERRMAVYSPHTSLDSLEGGVTDWLVSGLGEGTMSALGLSLHSPQPPQLLIAHGLAQQAAAELASKMDLRSKPAER